MYTISGFWPKRGNGGEDGFKELAKLMDYIGETIYQLAEYKNRDKKQIGGAPFEKGLRYLFFLGGVL